MAVNHLEEIRSELERQGCTCEIDQKPNGYRDLSVNTNRRTATITITITESILGRGCVHFDPRGNLIGIAQKPDIPISIGLGPLPASWTTEAPT
jgi:hypothetical protein